MTSTTTATKPRRERPPPKPLPAAEAGPLAAQCNYSDLARLWGVSRSAAASRMRLLAKAYGSAPWLIDELPRGRAGRLVNAEVFASIFPSMAKPAANVDEAIEELRETQEAMMKQIRELREFKARAEAFQTKAHAWFAKRGGL